MEKKIKVRFAPSPTGPLHIGGVRTALFNYLFAKKNNGDFLLRIEDTDQTRFVPGAEQYIIESLKWLGISPNEGVGIGGPHQPYRQSERREIYKQYAEKLVVDGNAYYAFDTPAELEESRKKLEASKSSAQTYDSSTRMLMKNSLTLTEKETKQKIQSGEPYVIRIKVPENEEIIINDIIRGEVRVNSSKVDDKVLYKSDGLPTYHMANVVDDKLMLISHVIRGEEWLPSTPIHVLLYRFLGWEKEMPQFAHLPLILKPDGNGKLSKRDGDRLGFPVFPLLWIDPQNQQISSGYRESGYFPEAVINILAFLGWNPGTTQEHFSINELIEIFSLERVGKAGAKFDFEKAKWFNQQYLMQKSNEELAEIYQKILIEKGIETNLDYLAKVCEHTKLRSTFVTDFYTHSFFFFEKPKSYDEKVVKKFWKENIPENLKTITSILKNQDNFSASHLETEIKEFLHKNQLPMGQVMNSLRLSLTGSSIGPGIFDIMSILGKNETIERIEAAINNIQIA